MGKKDKKPPHLSILLSLSANSTHQRRCGGFFYKERLG